MKIKIRKISLVFLLLTLFMLCLGNICYGLLIQINFNSIEFSNISKDSNLYVLVNEETEYTKNSTFQTLKEKVNENIVSIEEQYSNQKFYNELENTNETVNLNGKVYSKIKIIDDTTILWESSDILFANIVGDEIDIIDTEKINSIGYNDRTVKGYSGNFVNRKAIEYDAESNQLTDITEDVVNSETEKLNKIENDNEKKERQKGIIFIAILIVSAILISVLIGLVVDKLVHIYKKKNKMK